MKKFAPLGYRLFAIALIGFGIIQIITRDFLTGLLPVPATMYGRRALVYITAVIFIIKGLLIFVNRKRRTAALYTACLFGLFLIYPYALKLYSNLHDAVAWTGFGEILALASGALVIAGPTQTEKLTSGSTKKHGLSQAGQYLFGASLLIFGVLHVLYISFIETLIPAWIPAHYLWLYLIAAGFIAAGLSILLNLWVRLSASCIGIMFLIWVLILHAPLVFANFKDEAQWSSLFVALAMAGTGFYLAAVSVPRTLRGIKG